jgi:hypothetical protein
MAPSAFRAGTPVFVRPAAEILATLDASGRLDGLPFMPEMLAWCDTRRTVWRRVHKTCMEVEPGHYPNRRFPKDDVVILDGPRCDGSGHDGCHRGCRIFWKESWLRHIDDTDAPASNHKATDTLHGRLVTRAADGDGYTCQSTELFRATTEFPGKKKPWLARLALREVLSSEISPARLATLLRRWITLARVRAKHGHNSLRGTNTRTPTASLDLEPGELVRIRTRAEIEATLDAHGRNRGMGICEEMARSCGQVAEVRRRVDRIIEEKTGRMRPMNQTVMLHNLEGDPAACEECLCHAELGDCPRGELMYWREIWLERVGDRAS